MFELVISCIKNLHQWHLFSLIMIAYIIYYFILVVKRPILVCADGPFKHFLYDSVPTLETKFWPTFWCVESRAQTVFASIIRSKNIPNVKYRREIFTLKDGGEVALDWLEDNCAEDSPCIIILPGLTGESQAEYIKCLVYSGNSAGLRVVVFNNRGLGGITLKTRRLYCASNCEDLSEIVRYVGNLIPKMKLGVTGISMGGLILGNYLARHKNEARKYIAAANIISVPWDVHKGTASIEKPILNSLLGRHLAGSLCRTLTRCEIFKDSDVDLDKIKMCKTIKQFDELFTTKQFGYSHVDEYYADATLHNKLHHICVPLLCLSAADDPFQPLEAIPIKAAEESTHVAIVITARGGHIGFLEGLWPTSKEQYMGRLFAQYFTNTLNYKHDKFQQISYDLYKKFLKRSESIDATDSTIQTNIQTDNVRS